MTRLAAVAVALLLSGLLAGCQDKGPTTIEVAPGQVVEVPEPPKPTKGIVSSIVGDDAVYPLANATIFILGLGVNTTTDKNGRFAILDVPPGIYILEGSKKDHATVQTTVDVQPGEVARAVLLLPRVPPTDPYHTTIQHEAYIEFWTGYFGFGGSNSTLRFELDESTPHTLVLESDWEGQMASTTSATPFDFRLVTNEREVVAGPVPNPFLMHVDARVLPPGNRYYQFSMEPHPDTVVLQATGRMYATVFYNEPAPPQWSLLAGSV